MDVGLIAHFLTIWEVIHLAIATQYEIIHG